MSVHDSACNAGATLIVSATTAAMPAALLWIHAPWLLGVCAILFGFLWAALYDSFEKEAT